MRGVVRDSIILFSIGWSQAEDRLPAWCMWTCAFAMEVLHNGTCDRILWAVRWTSCNLYYHSSHRKDRGEHWQQASVPVHGAPSLNERFGFPLVQRFTCVHTPCALFLSRYNLDDPIVQSLIRRLECCKCEWCNADTEQSSDHVKYPLSHDDLYRIVLYRTW